MESSAHQMLDQMIGTDIYSRALGISAMATAGFMPLLFADTAICCFGSMAQGKG